ncbi:MAG: putative sulfate exporter family transporter, partial [Acidobacteria bacterium]
MATSLQALSAPAAARLRAPLPGLAVCAAAAAVALVAARFVGGISPLLIAIVLGALLANTTSLPAATGPGLAVASRRLLRIGVALLGLQLLVTDVLALGWGVLGLVVAVVAGGIAGTMALGRLLGLDWTQRLLVACGFSICGAAAVAAVDGVVDARK